MKENPPRSQEEIQADREALNKHVGGVLEQIDSLRKPQQSQQSRQLDRLDRFIALREEMIAEKYGDNSSGDVLPDDLTLKTKEDSKKD